MAKEKFEEALEKLERIVREMETGELPLDQSLKSFEEGIKLIRFCSTRLEETQRRVEQLMAREDGVEIKRFRDECSDEP